MANFCLHKAAAVSSYDEVTEEYTPAEGELLSLVELGGCAAHTSSVHVKILWGTDIIFVTHGSIVRKCYDPCECLGDGSKKLTISLKNDSLQSETIMAWAGGEKYV